MKIEQLKALVEVAQTGSINSATKKMYTTQQTLNKSLKNLEDELGVDLLNRTNKGVTFTKDGETVLRAAQNIISQLHVMEEELSINQSNKEKLFGNINIHISPMISISVFPLAYMEFINRYTDVNLYVTERYRLDIISKVSAQMSDLGILCVSNLIPNFKEQLPESVELHLVKQYPIYIAVSPTHPLAHLKQVSVRTILPYPIVVFEAGGMKGVHAFQTLGHNKVTLSTNNPKLCEEQLKKNSAVMYSFTPYLERQIFSNFVHIPVSDKPCYFNIYIAYNKDISPLQRKLIKAFVDIFQNYL